MAVLSPECQAVYAAMEGMPPTAWAAARRSMERENRSEMFDPDYRIEFQNRAWMWGILIMQSMEV